MPKDQKRQGNHRSFTVRVPTPMYVEMGALAQAEGVNLNQKVNQLLRLGMDKHIDLDTAIARLLRNTVTGVSDDE